MPAPIDRRALLAGASATLLAARPGFAQQNWPQGRQVKLVVPFTAGGATDVLGRLIADKLGQSWGSNIGIEAVAKSEPNGDTLLIASVGLATNRYLYAKVNYDPVKDLAPITMVALVPNLLVVRDDLPVKNVAELVAYAKANPGKLTFASSGVGTSLHLAGELFQKLTGAKMVHVPYRGSAQAIQDLTGGRVDLIFDNITSALPHAKAGTIRALGVTTLKRAPTAPDYPPIAETIPGFDVSSWFALFAPAKTPQPIVEKIYQDAKAGLADPSLRSKMDALAAEPGGWTPEELGRFLQSELKKWGDLIQEAGIKAE